MSDSDDDLFKPATNTSKARISSSHAPNQPKPIVAAKIEEPLPAVRSSMPEKETKPKN